MNARRRIVVTGAAKRVGRAIAIELARAGCDLDLTFHTSRDAMQATVCDAMTEASANGHAIDIRIHEVDLDNVAATHNLGLEIASQGPVAGVVHNASSYGTTSLDAVTADAVMSHFRVNAVAPLFLTQALAPALRAAHGAVVLFSDIHVLGRPRRNMLAYSMSKAAATDLVATLALELAPDVRVNAIAPGVIAWPVDAPNDERERYEARIPLARPGTPDDAARCVRWLLFEATYMTGETIRLDGGRWLR